MTVEVSDIAPVELSGNEEYDELVQKLIDQNEIMLAIIRDLESLDSRVTALEP